MEAEIINTGGDESERDADDAEPPGPYLVSPAAAFAELQHETIDLTEGDDEIPADRPRHRRHCRCPSRP